MPEFNFKPFPNLTTERLLLRQPDINDDKEILAIRSSEIVNKYLDRPTVISLEEARNFIHKINTGIDKNECFYWAITIKNTDKLIGTICLWNFSKENNSAEIGYELYPDFHGKGIMQEAIKTVIYFGFEQMKFETITAFTDRDNEKSNKLLEKNNFKLLMRHEHENMGIEAPADTLVYILKKQ